MGLTLSLGNQAGLDILKIGGLELVAFADTDVFLSACQRARLLVLGIEGFFLDGATIRPDLDAIADFSDSRDYEESIQDARLFLASADRSKLFFDFVLDGVPASLKNDTC